MSLSLSRSMTPLLPDLNEEHQSLQFFLSPNYDDSATNFSFLNTQYVSNFGDLHHHQEAVDYTTQAISSSSSIAFEGGVNELHKRVEDEDHYNIRVMQKMIKEKDQKPLKYTLRFQDHHPNYNETNNNNNSSNSPSVRVCSDCNTTTTPLWRSGPKGPKSLCNACGIRQRKARRAAMAAAGGNGMPETKHGKVKEKKPRIGHVNQCKKLSLSVQRPKISFKNFAFDFTDNNKSALHPVFSRDVEQAAILLMELSCGFVQS